jgi:hypothetical protein
LKPKGLIEAITHTRPNVDFVAFFVDPNLDQAGFPPHRDRCMDNPETTFFEDGRNVLWREFKVQVLQSILLCGFL